MKQKLSLVEKAKLYRRKPNRGSFSDDEMDLAIAWLAGEVSLAGTITALELQNGNKVYTFLNGAVQQAFIQGKILRAPAASGAEGAK